MVSYMHKDCPRSIRFEMYQAQLQLMVRALVQRKGFPPVFEVRIMPLNQFMQFILHNA
jgi:hypothetical protein